MNYTASYLGAVRNKQTPKGKEEIRDPKGSPSEYEVSLDDSIEDVFITVTTQFSDVNISLLDPAGRNITGRHVGLRKGVVYRLIKPISGVYTLVVPQRAGDHQYQVNAVSGTNIDFGHFYAYIPKRGRHRVPVPLDQPLHGRPR